MATMNVSLPDRMFERQCLGERPNPQSQALTDKFSAMQRFVEMENASGAGRRSRLNAEHRRPTSVQSGSRRDMRASNLPKVRYRTQVLSVVVVLD